MRKLEDYAKHSIRTFTGLEFNLLDMDPETICIEDIAHGLSQTARFAGQLPTFYSVAQHCWLAFNYASFDCKLEALLHDASEAYLGDMPSPFKNMMPEFSALEKRLMDVIAAKFNFISPLPKEVHQIDSDLIRLEWDSFIHGSGHLKCWSSEKAEKKFLEAFKSLQQ